uniref:hypothetical protein n=1 Tax=Stappia sp. TaxID=1870903 RepID=UPI003BA960C3
MTRLDRSDTCPDCGCGDGQAWDGFRCDACGHGKPCMVVAPPAAAGENVVWLADHVDRDALYTALLREAQDMRTAATRVETLVETLRRKEGDQ